MSAMVWRLKSSLDASVVDPNFSNSGHWNRLKAFHWPRAKSWMRPPSETLLRTTVWLPCLLQCLGFWAVLSGCLIKTLACRKPLYDSHRNSVSSPLYVLEILCETFGIIFSFEPLVVYFWGNSVPSFTLNILLRARIVSNGRKNRNKYSNRGLTCLVCKAFKTRSIR